MKKIAGKVTDIDFFSRKSILPTCPIGTTVVRIASALILNELFYGECVCFICEWTLLGWGWGALKYNAGHFQRGGGL